ncbi:putative cyclin-A1-1 [Iris pallida]|uniref:Cyclin-A1-1 n=1 Tax=Iris pallida TaxID=29817 RepID=A0AAX6DZC1_IRIPA|nr:putative cyclin-A1-1 [Iris pallida]
MSTRRSSIGSASALAKRPAVAGNLLPGTGKGKVPAPEAAKKRAALGNITNQQAARAPANRTAANKAPYGSSALMVKRASLTSVRDISLCRNSTVTSSSVKPSTNTSSKVPSLPTYDDPKPSVGASLAPCSTVFSPTLSDESVSLDESMSTSDSMKSPDFEYIDNGDSSVVASLERRAISNLHISEHSDAAGCTWKQDYPVAMEITDGIFDVDNNHKDPQLCATLACDIYNHLRATETKKRPSTDFMERVQKDINPSMRSILIDWLVEVAEEYRLVPDTLYLTVNYIDRYLSGNEMNRQRLQLLGVACMLIASKYEEICAPQVEEFCYITDNTYFKDEVLQMEAVVLKFLRFEITAPTIKCFLRRFVRVAQGCDAVPQLQLEFLASYLAELSLLEYTMLCYSPSLVAAAAIFLAKFMLQPSKHPWNATLGHYTLYKPSELQDCVKALLHLFGNSPGNNLPAIREKYSQHKYKFVAKLYCPQTVPSEFFQNLSS